MHRTRHPHTLVKLVKSESVGYTNVILLVLIVYYSYSRLEDVITGEDWVKGAWDFPGHFLQLYVNLK